MKTALRDFCASLQFLLGENFEIDGCDFNETGVGRSVTLGVRLEVPSQRLVELLRELSERV
jgi:hypothetical protein